MSLVELSTYYSNFETMLLNEDWSDDRFEIDESYLASSTSPFVFNIGFATRLNFLDKRACEIQYQLAYLSTLGGAYHLCNNPTVALAIAVRQEQVGRALGSSAIVIRSKVFQAVNIGLLGDLKNCHKMFQLCKFLATVNNWSEMIGFVNAVENWFKMNHGKSSKRGSSGKQQSTEFPSSQCCEVLTN